MIVDWEGPTFEFEHISSQFLYHESSRTPDPDLYEKGRRLADRVGCANCHDIPGLTAYHDLGPSLKNTHSIKSEWLIDWLPHPSDYRPGTPMPGFGLDAQQAADMTEYLNSVSQQDREADQETRMAMNVAHPTRGQLLFRSAGCLGCHTRGERDEHPSVQFQPDLGRMRSKRSAESVALYLTGASRSERGSHRPELGLSADAAAHLATYLTTGDSPERPLTSVEKPIGDPGRGMMLIQSIGCRACHSIPGIEPIPQASALLQSTKLTEGCLSDEPPFGIPQFGFDESQRDALRAFLSDVSIDQAPLPVWTQAQDILRRRNCLGCHSRDGAGGDGIHAQLPRFLAEDQELNSLKGTLTPPDLSSVGAKLLPEYLDLAIRGQAPTARPWLTVRMPRYNFEPDEAEAIKTFFAEIDQVVQEPKESRTSPILENEHGIRLLGRNGFGCLSCHVLNGKLPPGGEAETLGPDLALAHRRMTRSYYDRWLNDPQRILPGTAMPQFLIPVSGVEGTIEEQLGAVWEALGDPRLSELASTATRQFLARSGDRPLVVQDMVITDESPASHYPRGIAIGLKGDFSLLFDSDQLSWLRWWDQGFLSRTKQGRLWEWRPEGRTLWEAQNAYPSVLFRRQDGKVLAPDEIRGRFGSFNELIFEGNCVKFSYDLMVEDASLQVIEELAPTEDGWIRNVELFELPEELTPILVATSGRNWNVEGSRLVMEADHSTKVWIEFSSPKQILEGGPEVSDALLIEMTEQSKGSWSEQVRIRIRTAPK